MKDKLLQIRVDESFMKQLEAVQERTGKTVSDIIRTSIQVAYKNTAKWMDVTGKPLTSLFARDLIRCSACDHFLEIEAHYFYENGVKKASMALPKVCPNCGAIME